MNRTKIEWCDFTINPIKGLCKHACDYCYARRMYKRFKWNPKVRLEYYALSAIERLKEPSKIFVCSTHDIMGKWIPDDWIQDIIDFTKVEYKHTFIFLTKNPIRYNDFKFPKNCWLGQTITAYKDYYRLMCNNIRFISFEPLLDNIGEYKYYAEWYIVGGLTPKPKHKKEWVDNIVREARQDNIPIFLKDNLKYDEVIKEYPKC